MNEAVLEIENLTVEFPTKRGVIRAVNHVSLVLHKGEKLGLVGESGSGKSMTLLTLLRLTPHPGRVTSGGIRYHGRDLLSLRSNEMRALRGKDLAMIFQDPMTTLNPVYKVGEQIRESLRVHNLFAASSSSSRSLWKRRQRAAERKRIYELMSEVGIPSPAERYEAYPHEFSGGMQQRAVIAIALSCNPHVLLADEPTTALDVTVQAQIMNLLDRINNERGTAVILVTHDLSLAAEFCDRIAVMYAGKVVELGSVAEVTAEPKHPYTVGLINALPRMRWGKSKPLEPIPGEVDLAHLPAGCAFTDRCARAMERCRDQVPEKTVMDSGRQVCCHLFSGGQ
jgi:oligopeptide/dipeptide ABC transporter ATP-binding protein